MLTSAMQCTIAPQLAVFRPTTRSAMKSRAVSGPRRLHVRAAASEDVGTLGLGVGVAGVLFNPIVLWSAYTKATTGSGLTGSDLLGAAEGIGYLVVLGIVGWSVYTKVSTGSGLPAGPGGVLGAAEGLSYLSLLGGTVEVDELLYAEVHLHPHSGGCVWCCSAAVIGIIGSARRVLWCGCISHRWCR